ncbi:MAG TPA: hypothetical protein VK902_13660 [Rubrobacter sp.]|nr:hypothetical protein [Rubrobacter sp.]
MLLAAGRYVYKQVDVPEVLEQARRFRGFWPVVAQLPRSHPFAVRRVKVLYDLGFFEAPAAKLADEGVMAEEA